MKKIIIILVLILSLSSLIGCKEKTINKLNELVKQVVVACPKEKTNTIESIQKSDFVFSNVPKGYVLETYIYNPNIRDNRYKVTYKLTTKRKKYFSKQYTKIFSNFLIPEEEKVLIEEEINKISFSLTKWADDNKSKVVIEPKDISFKDKTFIKSAITLDGYNKKKYILRKHEVIFDEEAKTIRFSIELVYRTNLVSRKRDITIGGFKD